MSSIQLIADGGATKTSWCLLSKDQPAIHFSSQGINPYFFTREQITAILQQEIPADVLETAIDTVYFYGTGCAEPANEALMQQGIAGALKSVGDIHVNSDLLAAARGLCGREPGIAGILGTGSNSCFFDGEKIVKNNPAPGFILGDEGSGAYLGKKVLQYFIYNTFDEDLMHKFKVTFNTSYPEILQRVYKGASPNRYLASFAYFLSENRGHYMVENIIEDAISDFFFNHLYKYAETWTHPLHFSGGVAWNFQDVVRELCYSFELQPGRFLKDPVEGLIKYHLASVN